jgi:hypothetical protein
MAVTLTGTPYRGISLDNNNDKNSGDAVVRKITEITSDS